MKEKNNQSWNKKQNINYGIELLRMILCFWIVIIHCCIINSYFFKKIILAGFHVPTFIIISFYFYYRNLSTRNIIKIKLRFERLLIPYIIWPIILLIMNNLLLLIKFLIFILKKLYEK